MNRESALKEIRILAEEYVRENLPDEHPYFELIWNQAQHPLSSATQKLELSKGTSWMERFFPAGLGFNKSQRISIVTPAVILALEATALELGAEIEKKPSRLQVVEAIYRCSVAFGMRKEKARIVAENLGGKLQKTISLVLAGAGKQGPEALVSVTAPFMMWTSSKNGIGAHSQPLSHEELESHTARRNKYDIFIFSEGVSVRRADGHKPADIQGPMLNLLVLFLKNKDRAIDAAVLKAKAWNERPPVAGIAKQDPAKEQLKAPVSRLRTAINLSSFLLTSIKLAGYICRGDFSFCMIIPSAEDTRLCID